eukprot:TRINITY_DN4180_c0_g1_i5.p1 TRINITY_DN4180_c0_g1~~TRINITY_DN4180_c0_g1_i5.p1  ORF type:complete len:1068 (-),score=304.60 TRINITY_DN4180_c0_g1_i5:88-3252(-)
MSAQQRRKREAPAPAGPASSSTTTSKPVVASTPKSAANKANDAKSKGVAKATTAKSVTTKTNPQKSLTPPSKSKSTSSTSKTATSSSSSSSSSNKKKGDQLAFREKIDDDDESSDDDDFADVPQDDAEEDDLEDFEDISEDEGDDDEDDDDGLDSFDDDDDDDDEDEDDEGDDDGVSHSMSSSEEEEERVANMKQLNVKGKGKQPTTTTLTPTTTTSTTTAKNNKAPSKTTSTKSAPTPPPPSTSSVSSKISSSKQTRPSSATTSSTSTKHSPSPPPSSSSSKSKSTTSFNPQSKSSSTPPNATPTTHTTSPSSSSLSSPSSPSSSSSSYTSDVAAAAATTSKLAISYPKYTYTKARTGIAPNTTGEDDEDSSEDESIVNTVGNIPLEWYNEYDHIGYDRDGNKLMRNTELSQDKLDEFLAQSDDPNYWRTIYDHLNGKKVVLSDSQLSLVNSLVRRRFPETYNPYEDFQDLPIGWNSNDPDDDLRPSQWTMKTALVSAIPPKSRFLPLSKWENLKIRKLVIAIRKGWIVPGPRGHQKPKKKQVTDLWQNEGEEMARDRTGRLPPPKPRLPGHAESYHPPDEYLYTKDEVERWHAIAPSKRELRNLPVKYDRMVDLPAYRNAVHDQFERCLDLYLCPRSRHVKLNVTPESLLPSLPKPRDLRPFPTEEAMRYEGHRGRVRSISVNHSGEWLATGGDDMTLRIYEVSSGRCFASYAMKGIVNYVAWNPNPATHMMAVCVEESIYILTPTPTHGKQHSWVNGNETLLQGTYHEYKDSPAVWTSYNKDAPVYVRDATLVNEWEQDEQDDLFAKSEEEMEPVKTTAPTTESEPSLHDDVRVMVKTQKKIKYLTWHNRGDYFAIVSPDATRNSLIIFQLSKKATQLPFKSSKGMVQHVLFHPSKPLLFVSTKIHVRIYNLVRQKQSKKLMPGAQWISSLDIHPKGDDVIVGTYDKKVCWFDLELSTKPYRIMRYHRAAVRRVVYHKTFPMFASCSDDLAIHVFHGRVYNDLTENALIVPVKVLRGHKDNNGLGVPDIGFHPNQPWLFSAGADLTEKLWK